MTTNCYLLYYSTAINNRWERERERYGYILQLGNSMLRYSENSVISTFVFNLNLIYRKMIKLFSWKNRDITTFIIHILYRIFKILLSTTFIQVYFYIRRKKIQTLWSNIFLYLLCNMLVSRYVMYYVLLVSFFINILWCYSKWYLLDLGLLFNFLY